VSGRIAIFCILFQHFFTSFFVRLEAPYPSGFKCSGLCDPGYWCEEGSVSNHQNDCPSGTYGATFGLSNSNCTDFCALGSSSSFLLIKIIFETYFWFLLIFRSLLSSHFNFSIPSPQLIKPKISLDCFFVSLFRISALLGDMGWK